MTPEEAKVQLERLDDRLGFDVGAARERAKLERVVRGEPEPSTRKRRGGKRPVKAERAEPEPVVKPKSLDSKIARASRLRVERAAESSRRMERRRR